MKTKVIFSSLLFSLTVNCNAQLANGSIAPDWTFDDLNGVSHNLYQDLNTGKAVYMDFSATWCSPCWYYHTTGALETLWTEHGPSGGQNVSGSTTNDAMVYFLEADGTTGINALNGVAGIDGNTQGDWVTGVSHPIIDIPTSYANQLIHEYEIIGFPTVFMVCPDRTIKNVGTSDATSLYSQKSGCSSAITGIDAQLINTISLNTSLSCDSITPSVLLGNLGSIPLTSATLTYKVDGVVQKVYNWTGTISTYDNTIVSGIKIGASSTGSHVLIVTVSNPNGGTDLVISNNEMTLNFTTMDVSGGALVSETFESSVIPNTWAIDNGGICNLNFSVCPFGYNSDKAIGLSWGNTSIGNTQTMVLGNAISFENMTSPTLTFDLTNAQRTSASNDRLEVQVSDDCQGTWTTVYNKSGTQLATVIQTSAGFVPNMPTVESQWRHESVDLSAYAGLDNVYVRFKGTSDGGNNAFIDNINFTETANISENSNHSGYTITPNPATTHIDILVENELTNNLKVSIQNSVGQIVYLETISLSGVPKNHTVNLETFDNGLYYLSIESNNQISKQKILISK